MYCLQHGVNLIINNLHILKYIVQFVLCIAVYSEGRDIVFSCTINLEYVRAYSKNIEMFRPGAAIHSQRSGNNVLCFKVHCLSFTL